MQLVLELLLLGTCLFSVGDAAFPDGAPPEACDTLSPDPLTQGAAPSPCPEPCPYTLRVYDFLGLSEDSSEYFCGALHDVSLYTSGPDFQGFFIQTRETTPHFSSSAAFAGEFVNVVSDPEWQIRPCNGANAGATNTDDADKGFVSLTWRAPPRQLNPPPITFWLTILQQTTIYHVQLEGAILIPNAASCEPLSVSIGVSVGSVSVSEGDGTAPVCVMLLDTGEQPVLLDIVTFELLTLDITTDYDYDPEDLEHTFLPGTLVGTEGCVNIPIFEDLTDEDDESFLAILSSSTAEIDEDITQVIIIDNDEPQPGQPVVVGLSDGNQVVSEGDTVFCCVQILQGIAEDTHVILIGSIPDTASALDFGGVLQAVTFDVGSGPGSNECIETEIFVDSETEGSEDFLIFIFVISPSQQIQIIPQRMIKQITIIDGVAVRFGLARTQIEVEEDDGVALVCVELRSDQVSINFESVEIQSIDDTAVSCDAEQLDFVSLSATIHFPTGTPSGAQQCVCVTILDDRTVEGTEQFEITLSSTSGNAIIEDELAVVSILDIESDMVFGFTTENITVREDQGGVELCVILLSTLTFQTPVTLLLVYEDGEAILPEDYAPLTASVMIPANTEPFEPVCFPAVFIVNDNVAEQTERFFVLLQSGNNANVGIDEYQYTVTVYIEDDDGACLGLTSSSMTVSEEDGEVMVCVELLKPSVLVNESSFVLYTQDGTALDGRDYTGQSRRCRFPEGSLAGDSQCLSIPIIGNTVPDGDRGFRVLLTTFDQLVQIPPASNSLVVTITDNDLPQVRFERTNYTFSEGAGIVSVCVQLVGGPLLTTATALVTSLSRQALENEDFVPVQDFLSFSAGSNNGDTSCIGVEIIEDTLVEISQSFTLQLTSLTVDVMVSMEAGMATVTIIDNDVGSENTVGFKEETITVREDSNQTAIACFQICPAETMSRRKRNALGEGGGGVLGLSTNPGSATDGEDFHMASTELSINTSLTQTIQTCVSVDVINDDILEGDENIFVYLEFAPENVFIVEGAEKLSVVIEDDEVPAVGFQLVEATVQEASARKFTCVQLLFSDGPLESEVQVEFYTQDGSAEAPDDYESLVTTLTFRQGALQSFPSDAECVAVFVFDDVEPEETESLSFRLRSPDTSAVRIMQGRDQQRIFIVDNDVVDISMDRPSYSVMENVGEGELGLMVCATVLEADFDFTVLLIPEDDTAQEGVDFRVGPGRMDFFEVPGNQTRCVCVQIIDDSCFRGNRYFNLFLFCDKDSVRTSTKPVFVTIMDDEENDPTLRWINNSPRVSGDSVSADLVIGSAFCSVVCSVTEQEPQDCLSGSVVFTELQASPTTGGPLTLTVTGTLYTGTTVELTREFFTDVSGVCAAHLTDDGIVVDKDTVTVEWQGTGPSEDNQNTLFVCSLDSGPFNLCSSLGGYTQSDLPEGDHLLIISPADVSGGCSNSIDLDVNFIIDASI